MFTDLFWGLKFYSCQFLDFNSGKIDFLWLSILRILQHRVLRFYGWWFFRFCGWWFWDFGNLVIWRFYFWWDWDFIADDFRFLWLETFKFFVRSFWHFCNYDGLEILCVVAIRVCCWHYWNGNSGDYEILWHRHWDFISTHFQILWLVILWLMILIIYGWCFWRLQSWFTELESVWQRQYELNVKLTQPIPFIKVTMASHGEGSHPEIHLWVTHWLTLSLPWCQHCC